MTRLALIGVACVVVLSGCSSDGKPPAGAAVPDGKLLNLDPAVGYTGMEACRSCHLGVHSTYSRTGMALSFHPDGDRWIVGSGRHLQAALTEGADGVERLPVCRRAGADDWEECPDGEPGQEHVAGRGAAGSCRTCHDVADPAEVESQHGVDCERCHGPGELHVRRWKGTSDPGTAAADPTIVNPRRLPGPERMAVCLQCHLGPPRSPAGIGFRPGMALDVVVGTSPASREFGAAAQGERLMLSRCYLESSGRMDCTTCHNPHVSVYHEDRPPDLFRLQCLGCHAETDCPAPGEVRSSTSPPDDCAACHMRRAEPHDQRGTVYTDHWIRGNPDAEPAGAAGS